MQAQGTDSEQSCRKYLFPLSQRRSAFTAFLSKVARVMFVNLS